MAELVGGGSVINGAYPVYFFDLFRKKEKNILHVACRNLSQYGATQTLRPNLAVRLELTHDLKYCFNISSIHPYSHTVRASALNVHHTGWAMGLCRPLFSLMLSRDFIRISSSTDCLNIER